MVHGTYMYTLHNKTDISDMAELSLCSGPLVYFWHLPTMRDPGSRMRFSDSNRVLTIQGVTPQDEGIYTCVCSSRRSGTRDQKTFYLHVEGL